MSAQRERLRSGWRPKAAIYPLKLDPNHRRLSGVAEYVVSSAEAPREKEKRTSSGPCSSTPAYVA